MCIIQKLICCLCWSELKPNSWSLSRQLVQTDVQVLINSININTHRVSTFMSTILPLKMGTKFPGGALSLLLHYDIAFLNIQDLKYKTSQPLLLRNPGGGKLMWEWGISGLGKKTTIKLGRKTSGRKYENGGWQKAACECRVHEQNGANDGFMIEHSDWSRVEWKSEREKSRE